MTALGKSVCQERVDSTHSRAEIADFLHPQ
ncbi:hypothetical protein DR66_1748 [Delftia acidovorans]|nr:hypothetical protein DR66_1748 [Delftia acidovorans]TQL73542.1 hypothetical protein FB549_4302 [Delftia sp. HK171]